MRVIYKEFEEIEIEKAKIKIEKRRDLAKIIINIIVFGSAIAFAFLSPDDIDFIDTLWLSIGFAVWIKVVAFFLSLIVDRVVDNKTKTKSLLLFLGVFAVASIVSYSYTYYIHQKKYDAAIELMEKQKDEEIKVTVKNAIGDVDSLIQNRYKKNLEYSYYEGYDDGEEYGREKYGGGYNQGYSDGYRNGYDEGYDKGCDDGRYW